MSFKNDLKPMSQEQKLLYFEEVKEKLDRFRGRYALDPRFIGEGVYLVTDEQTAKSVQGYTRRNPPLCAAYTVEELQNLLNAEPTLQPWQWREISDEKRNARRKK